MSYSDWLVRARQSSVLHLLARARSRKDRPADYQAELLEQRLALSVTAPIATAPITVTPIQSAPISPGAVINTSAPFTPANIQTAYGVGSISFSGVTGNGSGQTIAIVDAYNDPNILSDAATFNSHFSLPLFNTTGNPTFTILNQTGGTTLPSNATNANGGWDTEISLDVEWAHSIAPKANIVLFEANSAGGSDLYTAVATAAAYSGVSVVSMSFGSSEFSGEQFYDSYFTTPSGHQGVTFIASTGDDSAPAEYPALSPNVLAVGGTTLALGTGGVYTSESTWGNGTAGASGGGGGISSYETQPAFQTGNVNGLSSTKRTAPDVSMLADPNTGVYMYDSWAGGTGSGGYYIAGGTSLAAPMWAGLIAIANQGRASVSLGTLDGPSQTLSRLYQLPSSDFHDITAGSNGYSATTGYDLATGLGTPIANLLVPALAGVSQTATKLSFNVAPSNAVAGASISPSIKVQVLDSFGNLDTGDSSTITLAFGNNAVSGTLSGTLTAAAVNGVATFSGLSINKAASGYTLTATDGSLTIATSASFTISAASASQLVITTQPGTASVGVSISPGVALAIDDAYGNLTTSSATITLTLNNGGTFADGTTTTTHAATSGVVTFSTLALGTAGSFTFTASGTSLTSATTSSFAISKATPIVGVSNAGGTYSGSSFSATSAFADDPTSGSALAVLGSNLLTYAYYAGTLTAPQIAGATPLGAAPISAGPYTIVATFAGTSNYNTASSSPANFTIGQRALHVTATAQNKPYDGTNAATVSLGDDRVSGDTLTIGDGGATFATQTAGNGIAVGVTGITMSGTSAANYTLAGTTASSSANITPVTITGSITANNKTYDYTTSATLATMTLSGVLGSDAVTLTGGSATFNSKDVASATTVTATGLTLGGAQASDYVLGNPTETASASISTLSITGSIVAASKVYDETTSATIVSRTLTGVLGSDSVFLIGGTAQFNSADVDAATTVSTTGSLAGAQASNYSLANPNETTSASVTPISLSASFTAANKVYDGTNAATISNASITGVLGGDDVSIIGGTATFNTKDVGTGKTVTATGISLGGAQAGDYSLPGASPTTTANITPLGINGSFLAAGRTYDGTFTATPASESLAGIIGNDTVAMTITTATFDSKDVGNGITVRMSGLSLHGAQAADYSLNNPSETTTANITPLTIIASVTAPNKYYDQTNAATIGSRSLVGVKGSDQVTLVGGSATFNSASVSSANKVTVTGLSITGNDAGDYTLATSSVQVTAHILPLSLSGVVTAADKTYDGSTGATISGRFLSGQLSGDDVSLTGGSATFDTKDVGDGKTVTAKNLTLSGAQATDYSLANSTETTTASVTPLLISGSIIANNKIYDATASGTIVSRSLSGVFAGDTVSLVGGIATFNSPDVATATTVTATGLTLTGAQAADYVLGNPTETTTASITPLRISGRVSATDKLFDGTTAATVSGRTLTGVLGNDNVALIGGSASFSTSPVGNNKPVTVSGLSLSGAQASDYTLANPTETTTASIQPLSISGTVFNDNQADGNQDTGDAGLGGRTVTLQIAGKGTRGQKTAKTDNNGNFTFGNLTLGSYVVKVTAPAHWHNTTPAGNGDTVALAAGQPNPSLAFGQSDAATVTGSVFVDTSKDGKRQAKETGLAGWTVILTTNGSSTPAFTATTDAGGNYTFSAVPVGNYQLRVVESSGYAHTAKAKSSYALALTPGKTVTGEVFGQQLIAAAKHARVRRAA